MGISLTDLPTELLESIFSHLPPESILAFQLTTRRIASIGNEPSLWKRHCLEGWRYWHPKHDLSKSLHAPVDTVDWKGLFRQRKETDRFVSRIVNDILATQQNRNVNTKSIVECGYDAKDELLRQCNSSDDLEDVLARKYYSEASLSCIHRSVAIQEWLKLRNSDGVPLENLLAAFDMFVCGKDSADVQEVTQTLDELASKFRTTYPDHEEMSIRQRAVTLVDFLRLHNFQGVEEGSYVNIQNNFIGLALRDPKHEALPLITVAIFSAVAKRVGINASCCGYPLHVYAIITAPDNSDLDGRHTRTPASISDRDTMYLDPFRSSTEISATQLKRTLETMGVRAPNHGEYLSPAATRDLVLRSSLNLQRSVREARVDILQDPAPGSPVPDQAWYGVIWANIVLTVGLSDVEAYATNALHLRQVVNLFTTRFQPDQPWDISLMELHLQPLFAHLPGREELDDFIRVTNDVDCMPKKAIRRSDKHTSVAFKVGQLFVHRRYEYEGVVIGWDPVCEADEAWIRQMKVDTTLSRGRHQSFYHVLVRDKSIRYVAEENIKSAEGPPSQRILGLAGRYFKRWSDEEKRFVSNIKDEYPDD